MTDLMETRAYALSGSDVRETRDGFDFRGYAAVFEAASRPLVDRQGVFTEVIKSGAFARALEERQDVLFTVDHDAQRLLGRTSSGTVTLSEDSHGLEVRATLPNTTLGRDTAEMISRRDLNGMSFKFIAAAGGSKYELRGAQRVRTLTDFARVADVCVTAMPAYEQTQADIEARMMFETLMELREGKMISAGNKAVIQGAIDALAALIAEEAEDGTGTPDARSVVLDLIERYGSTSVEERDSIYVPKPYMADADETLQCPDCGLMNDTDAKYCDQCGSFLVGQFIVEP